MIDFLKDFFGFTHDREPEGFLSWQHIVFVTLWIAIAVFLAVIIGRRMKDRPQKDKIKVLKITAIVMDSIEILKIINNMIVDKNALSFLGSLPLFLCSIILITLPVAAFSHGRLQEAGMDFVFIFGVLCMIAGTYLAANIFGPNPIIYYYSLNSATTHCISGFASLYITFSGLVTMKKKNLWITAMILLAFEALALIANAALYNTDFQHNYMFFLDSAGTPFSIFETISGGSQVIYTALMMLVYFAYLAAFICIYLLITKKMRHPEKE